MIHDKERFLQKISEYNTTEPDGGIGTLGERCLHSILKRYYDEDVSHHEQKVCGYVADIKNGSHIIEIQTNNFASLNKKLKSYLEEYDVTVVYPVSHIKYIVWTDEQTGEITERNRSPKVGSGRELLYEASKIREHLQNERLHFEILLIDMNEYKLLCGWDKTRKRGSRRVDRKPTALHDVIRISCADDLRAILPRVLFGREFTFADFFKAMKLREKTARYSLNALIAFGAVKISRKDGRKYIYTLTIACDD